MKQAGMMLIIKDGLILSICRRYNQNIFGLIGGKCDEGETPQQAAVRETLEETGITVKNCQLFFQRNEPPEKAGGDWFYGYTFFATEWEGEPTPEDGLVLKWLTEDQLIHGEMAAFPQYNTDALLAFRVAYPSVILQE
jgi:8-oxo-dGTP diphosphatase